MTRRILTIRSVAAVFTTATGLLAGQSVALAADPFGALSAPVVSQPRLFEIRLGVYSHDPFSPEKGSADINAELLYDAFPRDRSSLWGALVPRLHAGGTFGFAGKTSQAYAGLTWTWDITQKFFVEAGFGGAVHNGKTTLVAPVGFNAMGCGWGFHEQGTLGYRLSTAWSIMATVEHTSNAGLCKQNRGLTNVGLRLGYTF